MRTIHNRYGYIKPVSSFKAGILTLLYSYSLKKKLKMKDISQLKKNSFHYQLISFGYAAKGIRHFFMNETKSGIHLIASIVAIVAGILLKISSMEWILISFAIGFVFVTEIINTAVEAIVNQVNQDRNQTAGVIKDLAAAAVLIASLTALVAGLIIFIPKLMEVL